MTSEIAMIGIRSMGRARRRATIAPRVGGGSMLDGMKRIMDRACEVWKRFGVAGLVREAFDKAVLRRASLNLVHVLALEGDTVRARSIEPGYELRFLSDDEVARFSADPINQIGAEFVERARSGHDLCFGALCGDRLASYGWYALGCVEGTHASGVALGLPGDTAYLYKGFTHPDFRGRHLYPACMGAALAALRPRGIDRLIAFVYWSNAAALRSCEGLGYRSLGHLLVGPRGPIRVPVAARDLGVRFGVEAEVAIARAARTHSKRE